MPGMLTLCSGSRFKYSEDESLDTPATRGVTPTEYAQAFNLLKKKLPAESALSVLAEARYWRRVAFAANVSGNYEESDVLTNLKNLCFILDKDVKWSKPVVRIKIPEANAGAAEKICAIVCEVDGECLFDSEKPVGYVKLALLPADPADKNNSAWYKSKPQPLRLYVSRCRERRVRIATLRSDDEDETVREWVNAIEPGMGIGLFIRQSKEFRVLPCPSRIYEARLAAFTEMRPV